jgi:hypothetical protein
VSFSKASHLKGSVFVNDATLTDLAVLIKFDRIHYEGERLGEKGGDRRVKRMRKDTCMLFTETGLMYATNLIKMAKSERIASLTKVPLTVK